MLKRSKRTHAIQNNMQHARQQSENFSGKRRKNARVNATAAQSIVTISRTRQSAMGGSDVHRPMRHQSLIIMLPPGSRGAATGNPLNKPVGGRLGTPGARGANDADFPCRREKLHAAVTVGGALLGMPLLPIRPVIPMPGVASALILIPPRNGDNIDDFVVVVCCADCGGIGAVGNTAVALSGEV